MKTLAIRLDAPPIRKGMAPPIAASAAATQKDQTRRGSWLSLLRLNLEFTSGILCSGHPQDKPISGRSCISRFGDLPSRRHVCRLAKRQLLDEQGCEERDDDDRHPGEEDGVEGIRKAMADAHLDRGR